MDKVGFGEMSVVSDFDVPYGGAILKIEAGKQTDTMFHRVTGKIVYVLSGTLRATVMKNGGVSAIEFETGKSFFIKPGLVYNFYAKEETVVVEFTDPKSYNEDTYCIFKGTKPDSDSTGDSPSPEDVMKMNEEDKAVAQEKPNKKTKRKSTTKRKVKSKKGK
jgi:quercetin dioxygenase-like cupin family protein